eukprot:4831962-Prymnesium_polylepis.1
MERAQRQPPRARSTAVEFSVVRMAVQKFQRCENQYVSRSRCTFWDTESVSKCLETGGGMGKIVAFRLDLRSYEF